jgi:butyryl-CoA dehydrogenase
MDVSEKPAWQRFLSSTANQFGHIDILINNAGIEGSCQPVWASDDDILHKVMDVNFYGMVYGSKAALPYLVNRPWASLVNVSSVFGFLGPPNTADYSASKFAIRGYTESLRAELAQVHPQVQVQLVHPGGINTNITRLPQSQKFKQRFLTTKPSDIALHIAKSIMKNKARIVYGNQAALTSLASKLLPLEWLSKLVSRELDGLDMKEDYTLNHIGLTIPKNHVEKA